MGRRNRKWDAAHYSELVIFLMVVSIGQCILCALLVAWSGQWVVDANLDLLLYTATPAQKQRLIRTVEGLSRTQFQLNILATGTALVLSLLAFKTPPLKASETKNGK